MTPLDELDVFNATVTLALAAAARNPGLFSPLLSSEVAPLYQLDNVRGDSVERSASHLLNAKNMFSVYQRFWLRFPYQAEPVKTRLVVNAPVPVDGAVVSPKGTFVINAGYDVRGGYSPLPDNWAIPHGDNGYYIDDLVFFSDVGLDETVIARLSEFIGPGTSVTFLRPSPRCWWYQACGVSHMFESLWSSFNRRAVFEGVFRSPESSPIMASVFGATELILR